MKQKDTQNSEHEKNCVSNTMKIIGSKWTVMIIRELFDGTKRFGQLQRSLPGISPKTLSSRLQDLEREGVINKKVFAEIPLHVEYSLTNKGKSLRDILIKMYEWGAKSLEEHSKPTLSTQSFTH